MTAMRWLPLPASLLLVLLAVGPAVAASMQDLVGLWYGEGYQPVPDRDMQWIVERRADGTFEAEFRIVNQCQVEVRQVETGRWGVFEQGFFTIVETIDGIAVLPRGPDPYTIERIDENSIDYTHLGTGTAFKARRVQQGFSMPACVS